MKKVLFILGILGFAWSATAVNPHFRLLRAKENTVKSTEIGTFYSSIYEKKHGNALILFDRVSTPYTFKNINSLTTLRVNWELHGSDHDYLSWILMQGLVRYSLEDKFSAILPNLFELDAIAWVESMRFLDQLGIPVDMEMDYASHPRFDFARRMDISIVRYYRLYKRSRLSFYKVLKERKRRFEGSALSVEDYLNDPNLTSAERKAGLELKAIWDAKK